MTYWGFSCYWLENVDFLELYAGQCYVVFMEIRLPPDQEAHLATVAASTGLTTDDLVRDAIALWQEREARQGQAAKPKHTPAQAAARIRELREGNFLPPGESIKDLINHGRA